MSAGQERDDRNNGRQYPLGVRRLIRHITKTLSKIEDFPQNLSFSDLSNINPEVLQAAIVDYDGDIERFVNDVRPIVWEVLENRRRKKDAATDPISMVMFESSEEPLLDREEEVALSLRFRLGRKAKEILTQGMDTLTPIEKERLERQVVDGEECYEILFSANLRLVNSIAVKYGLMDFQDNVQEGRIGLQRAIEKFDPNKGNKFSTYATWWIRQRIGRTFLDRDKMIRLPVYVQQQLSKVFDAEEKLLMSGREPTPSAVAEITRISKKSVVRLKETAKLEPRSLNEPIGEDVDLEFGDTIPDYSWDPEAEAMESWYKAELRSKISSILDRKLTPRERHVLLERLGGRTLEDIAENDLLNSRSGDRKLTRERIRQIQKTAMKKVDRPVRDLGKRLSGIDQNEGNNIDKTVSGSPEKGLLGAIFSLTDLVDLRITYRRLYCSLSYQQIAMEIGVPVNEVIKRFGYSRVRLWETLGRQITENPSMRRYLLHFPDLDPGLMQEMVRKYSSDISSGEVDLLNTFFGINGYRPSFNIVDTALECGLGHKIARKMIISAVKQIEELEVLTANI